MTLAMVNQYHEFLLSHLVSPFSLLINKVNAYTYDFDAQVNLATLKEINAMAVVSYTRSTKISTEYLTSLVPRKVVWKLKIFTNRDEALNWLKLEQGSLKH
ncbi:STAS/SEC14 domain-containing protein [Shewanella sp.]|uniref:STAS/SEC14 domain-containing protein n=1 Tax=Shewanella sp. TaxID=50422 RepID=UPI0025D2A7B3|nr:STAS/SEC14 domain-containing protein [Shewanella sp.]